MWRVRDLHKTAPPDCYAPWAFRHQGRDSRSAGAWATSRAGGTDVDGGRVALSGQDPATMWLGLVPVGHVVDSDGAVELVAAHEVFRARKAGVGEGAGGGPSADVPVDLLLGGGFGFRGRNEDPGGGSGTALDQPVGRGAGVSARFGTPAGTRETTTGWPVCWWARWVTVSRAAPADWPWAGTALPAAFGATMMRVRP